jgi:hypothetical protein
VQAQLRAAVFSVIDEEEKKEDTETETCGFSRLKRDASGEP